MHNKKIVDVIKILVVVIIGFTIIYLSNILLLSINTEKILKTNLFKERDNNDQYCNYLENFEDWILSGEYQKAYESLDKYNAEERFDGIDDFQEKMTELYSSANSYAYNVSEIIVKENYKDIYIKLNIIYADMTNDIVEFMIREYEVYEYKIYIRTVL